MSAVFRRKAGGNYGFVRFTMLTRTSSGDFGRRHAKQSKQFRFWISLARIWPSNPADAVVDSHLLLSEWVVQYLTYRGVSRVLLAIERDLLNGLASLHKYFIILRDSQQYHSTETPVLVATEMEYAFGNHRSFYDLLHRLVSCVYGIGTKKEERVDLGESFAKAAQKGTEFLTGRYHLPAPLVAFYGQRLDHFMALREIRDGVYHRGFSFDGVLVLPEGFAIRQDDNLHQRLETLDIWDKGQVRGNGAVSLLPILAYLVDDMCEVMAELSGALSQSFMTLPDPMFPGYHLYLRSPLTRHLNNLHLHREKPWHTASEVMSILQGSYG